MFRLLRLLPLALLSFALAACTVVSTSPLLPVSHGVDIFGQDVVAVDLHDGALLDDKGTATVRHAHFDQGRYVIDTPAGDPTWYSLQPIKSFPFEFVLEMGDGSTVRYFAARVVGDTAYAQAIDLTDEERQDIVEIGDGRVTPESGDDRVDDFDSLLTALSIWADDRKAMLDDVAYYPYRMRVASGAAAEQLEAEVRTQTCLAAAGHPADPAVRKLPPPFNRGLAQIDEIDPQAAEERCGWAELDKTAPPNVRYALYRAYTAANDTRARPLLDTLVDQNFSLAIFAEADILLRQSSPDPDAALALMEAHLSDPRVAFLLGGMFEGGRFGVPDYVLARRYYEQAAAGGSGDAEYALSLLYGEGRGVDKDPVRAFELEKSATQKGSLDAFFATGLDYFNGTGTPQDPAAAFDYFVHSAKLGDRDARYFTGFMAAYGEGTAKDERLAVEWLTEAMNDGAAAAKTELGRMIYSGLGTPADEVKGRRMLEEMRDAGDQIAVKYLAQLEQPAQLPPLGDNVPPRIGDDLATLAKGEAIDLDGDNSTFMSGLADTLVQTCGLPEDPADRLVLSGMVLQGSLFTLGNMDFSNPDFGAALGDMFGGSVALAAGGAFGNSLDCSSRVAHKIADGLVKTAQAGGSTTDPAQSRFVRSCTPAFDAERCGCLAKMARDVMPDIYDDAYDRSVIPEIVSRNPMLGIAIGVSCGISDY